MATTEDIQIYGKLVNVSTEGVVADASQIWSEKNRASVEDVLKSVSDNVEDFRSNPEFENATFHGNALFEGNTTVEGKQTVKGNQEVQGNQIVRGSLDVYDILTAHGNPISIAADHKITTNDLEVMGVFSALNLDCNTLTVHKLLKSEGDARIDGDMTVNNITVNGRIEGIYAQTFLPEGKEGNILIYTNGQWRAGDNNAVIDEITINNKINQAIKDKENDFDSKIAQVNQKLEEAKALVPSDEKINSLIDAAISKYWTKNQDTLTPAEGITNVIANHFYKRDSAA